MKLEQVAVILFTLRDHCKTMDDLARSLEKVAAIGYKSVQVSGVPADLDPAQIKKYCDANGLTICASHENGHAIFNETEAIIERLNSLDCQYTAYPYPGGVDFQSEDSVTALIDSLNKAGKTLHEAGKTLLYHNHQVEFIKQGNKPILEHIYDRTDARYLQGEPDTYWVQFGGGSPVAWCQMLRNRLPVLHMKDYMINADGAAQFCEIGNGVLPFKDIVREAEASGCQWFVVEQDRCPGDPFDSIQQSFDYIKAHLVD